MNKIKHTIPVIILLAFGITGADAQSTVSPTGADASSADGRVSYTIGQVDYINSSGTSGFITEGVQQPWEILVIAESPGITLKHTLYPNPAVDHVTLNIEGYQLNNMNYMLYDNNGKLITERKVEDKETKIKLNDLPAATYYIKVSDGKTELSVYKLTINK